MAWVAKNRKIRFKTGINKYELLLDGGVDFIPGMNDLERWDEVIDALRIMNFSSEEIQNWKILSSVARLLKIEESEPEKSLTQRIVNAKGVSVKCTLNTAEAEQTQKSLVKALYGRFFIGSNNDKNWMRPWMKQLKWQIPLPNINFEIWKRWYKSRCDRGKEW